jgi:asparagine synthetase B (glutamine-hydrolysing)
MLAFNMPLLRRAAHEGITVMLDGEGGDELFGCSEYLLADRILRGDIRGAISLARRFPGVGDDPKTGLLWALVREYGLKGAAPHGLHRMMRRVFGADRYAPRWLKPPSAKRYLELHDEWAWKKRGGPRWWGYLADLLTSGRERIGVYDLLRQRASLAGLANRHPLLEDIDLVELVLRVPPELAFDPELTRPLARDAVVGLLPDEIRLRPDKVDFSRLLIEALSGPDRALATQLLGAKDAELWAYAEPKEVGKLLETPLERRGPVWARVVSRLATTESWLRSQADPSFPQRLLEEHSSPLSDGARSPRADGRAVTW